MPLKRFLMASALALSFVVSAPTVAKADPITAAIVTWAGFTAGTTAFAVATFVVNSALYAAGSWAVTKAAKALGLMKTNVAERQASVTTLSLGETPREAVVGIACVGGSLIDAWNHGGKYGTDYVTRRVALADHVLDGLIGYYVDDTYYPFNGNGVQPGFSGALQLTFVNATRDGAFPPPYILQAGVGLTSADRCPSVAEIWITYKFDDQVWTRGHPGLKFVVRGLRAYDPRFDPQYGYTGPSPQTWDDVSTHRFSENAAIVRYNIQRGVYAVGRHGELEHLLIGRGLTADEAPAARIIAAANVCDEIVDGRPRYTVGGAISSAQAHIEVEEMFAAATAGQIVQRDGGVEVEPGQAKAAVVTITDADLVAGEAISFDEFTPDTDGGRINTVIARYVEPSQLYKDHSGAVLRDQADIVEDGGPRELTLPLMLVTNKGQADRCAEITRRGARLERRARIALVPMLLAGRASAELEDGDIIAWQSNRYHEGATVRYRIEAYGVDEGWRNTLQLREMASSVFGQADPVEDRAAPPPAPTPIDALVLTDVTAEAITLPGDSSILPAIRFRWDAPVDAAVLAIRAEVRRLGDSESAPTRTEEVNAGVMIATNGVGPDQQLQARLVPIGDPSRPVLASAWVTVSTSGLVAGDVSPTAPGLSQIRSDIEAAFGNIFDVSELLGQARTDIDAQGQVIDGVLSDVQALDTGLNGVQQVQATQQTQIDGKASQTDLNATITRVGQVETVNGTQTTQISDLNTGKASVQRVDFLEARQSQPKTSIWPSQFVLSGTSVPDWSTVLDGVSIAPTSALATTANRGVRASPPFARVLWAKERRIFLPIGDAVPVVSGRKYRLRFAVKTAVNRPDGAVSSSYAGLRGLTSDGVGVANFGTTGATSSGRLANGWRYVDVVYTVTAADAAAYGLMRPFVFLNNEAVGSGHGEQEVAYLEVSDVTQEQAQLASIAALQAMDIDLENNKASAVEFNAIKAEVTAARNGKGSVSAELTAMRSATATGDQSNATAITNVTARTENAEADIIDLENALATETGARAEAISQIEARSSGLPNTIQNPDYKAGFVRWHQDGAGAVVPGNSATIGPHVYFECPSIYTDIYPCSEGDAFSLSQEGATGAGGRAYIQFLPSYGFGAITPFDASGAFSRVRSSTPAVAPAGTTGFRIWVDRGVGAFALATRFKVNSGPVAADYSDDADIAAISASVTEQSLAIIDLENQQNIALFRVKSEASGSRPAIIEAYSGLGISAIAFSAEQLYLGDNTVFDDATNTWQTIDGSTVYIRAEGAPFGAFSNLREWWGPTGIALGAMTPDNGYSGRMTTAPYNFTNTLNPRTFSAYASPGSIEAHRSTAGSLTSAAVSILYQNAKGAVSVTWARLIGGVTAAGSAVIDAPNELTTTFTKTVSAQERTDTVFQATLTDAGSGERRQVIVPVVFTSGAA